MEELIAGPVGLMVIVIAVYMFIRTSKLFKSTGKTVEAVMQRKLTNWTEDDMLDRNISLADMFDDIIETHGSLEIVANKATAMRESAKGSVK